MTIMEQEKTVFNQVTAILVELFDLDAASITLDTRLFEDLDLDSIDAVDMIVYLQKQTGKKVKPEDFKEVRTVHDIVNVVESLLQDA